MRIALCMKMDPDSASEGLPSMPTNAAAGPVSGEAPPPGFIPDHQLLRRIGGGSYGEVWLARHVMGMYRAVKIVYRKSFKDQRPFERELSGIRQFEPISRSHEGFVDVLHVGLNEDHACFYYVMELGDGQESGQNIEPQTYAPKTLASDLTPRPKFSVAQCLQLGLALSQAVAELHKHGLVHRDIKPSNIIFVNGVPKLADIGLVAPLNDARSYVGTEGFIPPEGPGTARADVYSLGKVLYEVSTGKDRQDFPALPTRLDELADREQFLELNEVLLHACQNEPNQRYQSAWEMHADLVVLANGKSVRRLRLLERRLSGLKRAALLVAVAVAMVAAISYPLYHEHRITVESRQRQVGENVAYGTRAMEAGDLLGALPYFADALRLDAENPERQATHRLRLGALLAQCPKLTHMWSAGMEVGDAQFSPDGRKVLLAQHFYGKAQIYDLGTEQFCSQPFGQNHGLATASYSPDGRYVVTASEDNTACLWDAASLKPIRSLMHPNKVFSARFSPDGLRLVTACKDGVARVWTVQTGAFELQLKKHTDALEFAAFSHDGRLIVTASRDATARIWDAQDGRPVAPALRHAKWVMYAAFSPDNKLVVTASDDHKARVWEVGSGRKVAPDLNHGDGVRSAEFSPDGRLILTSCLDGTARLWLADTWEPFGSAPILWHNARTTHAAFSPEGRRIVTSCVDGTLRVWDLAGIAPPPPLVQRSFSSDKSRFLTVAKEGFQVWDTLSERPVSPAMGSNTVGAEAMLSQEGRFLLTLSAASGDGDGGMRELRIVETATGKQFGATIVLTNCLSNALARVSIARNGKRLLVWRGKTAEIWDVIQGTALGPGVVHAEEIRAGMFNPLGGCVATWSEHWLKVWRADEGREFFAHEHPFTIEHVEFSPDGSRLVACGAEPGFRICPAQVREVLNGHPVGAELNHGDGILYAAFSGDGRRVATASEDFTALVWDAETGAQLIRHPLKHKDQVWSANFSPDSEWVVTASSDKTARLWSATSGDPLTPPLRHLAKLVDARFLADGRGVITSDAEGNAWIWHLPVDGRPIEGFMLLARLLSGDTIAPSEGAGLWRMEPLQKVWQRLRAKYPRDFETSVEEIAAWHQFEAQDSELQEQWSAAAFHLERLLALRPGDQSLKERLARARRHQTAP